MSTILETVDNPTDAIAACRLSIKELLCLPGVKECFKVELKRGFTAWVSKEERRKLISTVCLVNRAVYDVMLMVDFGRHALENWPCVDIGEKEVSPLLNESNAIAEVLKKCGLENCSVPWSLGQDSTEKHELTQPWRIPISVQGHFLIVDQWGPSVKVFDNEGNFYLSFFPKKHNLFTESRIIDIGTAQADMDWNIYLLVELAKTDTSTETFIVLETRCEVQVFNKTANLLHTVFVRNPGHCTFLAKLTVTCSKLLLLVAEGRGKVVYVYGLNGYRELVIGVGVWSSPTDITATCDGHVMIVDHPNEYDSCVYVFTVTGRQLTKFNIDIRGDYYHSIAYHPTDEHVVVAGCARRSPYLLRLAIYTADGAYVQKIQLDEEVKLSGLWPSLYGVSVTMEGHIALSFQDKRANQKVIVV